MPVARDRDHERAGYEKSYEQKAAKIAEKDKDGLNRRQQRKRRRQMRNSTEGNEGNEESIEQDS
jgi:hypothetical protein